MTERFQQAASASERFFANLIDSILLGFIYGLILAGGFVVISFLLFIGGFDYKHCGSFFEFMGLLCFMDAFCVGFTLLPICAFMTKPAVYQYELCCLIAFSLLSVLYHAGFESSVLQGTIGKRLRRIVVSDTSGNRISFARACARHFSKLASFPLLLGYVLIAFRADHRALHDILSRTNIVSVSAEQDAVKTSWKTSKPNPVRSLIFTWCGFLFAFLVGLGILACQFCFTDNTVKLTQAGLIPLALAYLGPVWSVMWSIFFVWNSFGGLVLTPLEILRTLALSSKNYFGAYNTYLHLVERLPLSRSPVFAIALNNAGHLYQKHGMFDRAQSYFQSGLNLISGEHLKNKKSFSLKVHSMLLTNIAYLALLRKEYDKAYELASSAASLLDDGAHPYTYLWLAQACLETMRLEEAETHLKIARNQIDEEPAKSGGQGDISTEIEMVYWRTAGDLARKKRSFDEAEFFYNRCIELASNSGIDESIHLLQALVGLAISLQEQGKQDQSTVVCESARAALNLLPLSYPRWTETEAKILQLSSSEG